MMLDRGTLVKIDSEVFSINNALRVFPFYEIRYLLPQLLAPDFCDRLK